MTCFWARSEAVCRALVAIRLPYVSRKAWCLGAGRHLRALINDILDLSKIEAGRMELHLETFPLLPVIKDVAKTIEPMVTKNGNRLVIER